MQADQCRYGVNCRFLKQNKCHYSHPSWHKKQCKVEEQKTQGKKPCVNGADCRFMKKGSCNFYHPPEHRRITKFSSFFGLEYHYDPTPLEYFQHNMQQAKKLKEQREKRRRQQQQQRERDIQRERQRLIGIQNLLLGRGVQLNNKSSPEYFEWYFGKNKSFKALQVSQEKLHALEQCIICYVSYTGEKAEEVKPEKLQQKEKLESKEKLEQKSEIKPSLESKEHLQKELTELYCKHTFHKECIKKWLSTNEKCPICRKDFKDHADYNKWQDEKKKLKFKEPEMMQVSLGINRPFSFEANMPLYSMFERLQLNQYVESDDEDQLFFQAPDYEEYGYGEDDMWDIEPDEDY